MSNNQKRLDTAATDSARAFPFALLVPLALMLILGLGSAGTFAGVRARRRDQEREGLPALLAMVPAAALTIAGLLGIAALRRRRDRDTGSFEDGASDDSLVTRDLAAGPEA